MSVTVMWDFHFRTGRERAGAEAARSIWQDMRSFRGYVTHRILRDQDDPAHLVVISEWTSREAADQVRASYQDHPNAVRADNLVDRPRVRTVAQVVAA